MIHIPKGIGYGSKIKPMAAVKGYAKRAGGSFKSFLAKGKSKKK